MKLIVEALNEDIRLVIQCKNTKESRAIAAEKGVIQILKDTDHQLVTILCTEDAILHRLIKKRAVRYLMPSSFPLKVTPDLFKQFFQGSNVLIDPNPYILNQLHWYYETAKTFSSRIVIYCRYDPFIDRIPAACMDKGLLIRAGRKHYE